MAYWLFKSEPDVFGWDDLVKRGDKGEPWDGVKNYLARNNSFQHKLEMARLVKKYGYPMVLCFVLHRRNQDQVEQI